MRDWNVMVRDRLSGLELAPEHESAVIEEIAAQLEDCYNAARRAGMSDKEASADAISQVTDWTQLAMDIREARPTRRASSAERWMSRSEERGRARGGAWSTIADLLQELRITWRRLARF